MTQERIPVGSFSTAWAAATAKALLEVRGIPSVLVGAEVASLLGSLTSSLPDPVRLEVAAEDRVEAERLLQKLASGRDQKSPGGGTIADPETCLQCGSKMRADEAKCPRCNWSYLGEETTEYENGPVPDSLLAFARSPLDSRRFALPAAAAIRYAFWCVDRGYTIRGWEVWLPGVANHTVVQVRESVDDHDLVAAIPDAVRNFGEDVLFCVLVGKRSLAASP